jgi:hypothetical protein
MTICLGKKLDVYKAEKGTWECAGPSAREDVCQVIRLSGFQVIGLARFQEVREDGSWSEPLRE